MTKILSLFLLTIILTFSSFTDNRKNRKAVFKSIAENVAEKGRAYENLLAASDSIGHRLTGSKNAAKAEQLAFDILRNHGFKNVKYHPFEVNSWTRNKVNLVVVPGNSDNFREVETVSLAYSPIAANITERIVDCGDGLEGDFDQVASILKGNVALFNIDIQSARNKGLKNLHRSEKTALAIKNGAAAVIIANAVDGGVLLTGTASVNGKLIPVPAICISKESGRAIRRWIRDERNILASIDMLNYFQPVRARNISAVHSAQSKFANEKIVIGGHLDSWDLATGAVDNGLGAFSVLDIARVFKDLKLKTKRPIEFVLFMGEEQGMLGSTQYIAQAKKNGKLKDIGFMINLDMINNTQGFNAMGNTSFMKFVEKIGSEIKEVDAEYTNQNGNAAYLHSDHQAFLMEGIPVCRPIGELSIEARNCYHANCDYPNLIDKKQLNNNVKYTAMLLYALANADQLPKRKSSLETRDFLIDQNLKKELILAEKWLWEE